MPPPGFPNLCGKVARVELGFDAIHGGEIGKAPKKRKYLGSNETIEPQCDVWEMLYCC